jgi:nicotinamide-nucleotide amidase
MDTESSQLAVLAEALGKALQDRGQTMTAAESCTGGWIAKAVTDIPGSSGWFECAFVTYGNEAKQAMLGVKAATLAEHGAVSEQTVREMVLGALARSRADFAVAVSGIAGPAGGSAEKPIGTVWFAWAARDGEPMTRRVQFGGDREAVRLQSVVAALGGFMSLLAGQQPGGAGQETP